MDIVTHALIGTALASGAFAAAPLEASAFVLGNVLPDVDALGRVFGRVAFLRGHQTLTHALPVQAALATAAAAALATLGSAFWHLPLVLAAGAALHSLLDASNTYGVTLLWPLRRERVAWEWVFFIDAGALALTLGALGVAGPALVQARPAPGWLAPAYLAAGLAYWGWRARLRARAAAAAPAGTMALIPSALWPRRFYGVGGRGEAETGGEGRCFTFVLDLDTAGVHDLREHQTLDHRWAATLQGLPEYRAMRDLSAGYRVTGEREAAGGATWVECRDLRTRNFGGDFGRLEVRVGEAGPEEVLFHV